MTRVETSPAAGPGLSVGPRDVAGPGAAGQSRRPGRVARLLRRLVAGLNALLKLDDFSRGDIFRD